jgi:hypothetical protein
VPGVEQSTGSLMVHEAVDPAPKADGTGRAQDLGHQSTIEASRIRVRAPRSKDASPSQRIDPPLPP